MEQELSVRWKHMEHWLEERFGKQLSLEGILFLIGVRELGAQPQDFSKEQKVDLMHIAICKLLSLSGYYELTHTDQEGWPHWKLLKPLPHTDIFSQEYLLKEHILSYFESEGIFSS